MSVDRGIVVKHPERLFVSRRVSRAISVDLKFQSKLVIVVSRLRQSPEAMAQVIAVRKTIMPCNFLDVLMRRRRVSNLSTSERAVNSKPMSL